MKIPGKTATWKPKNRVSVAPVTSSPPRRNTMTGLPIRGITPAMSVPTFVAKNASSFQGRRYPLNPNPKPEKEHEHPGQPGDLARSTIGAFEKDAEHMDERRQDEKVRRPAVDRPDEPAELDL